MDTVIIYSFVACTIVQICYYIFFSFFLFTNKKRKKNTKQHAISVIICAKNEAENLKNFLPSILNQNYSNFEIVLINDASNDETLTIMEAFATKHNNIKIVDVKNIETFWGNKKYALTLGIKASSNNHLLFTDADCKPVSKNWIAKMNTQFSEKKTIILGYGKYKRENKLVNLFVRFETLLTAIQYFSYAKVGSAYMAVGRNLAYTKEDFFNVKGFINHMHIKSGDDDLFIQDASNTENTTICIDKGSFTESIAPSSLRNWFLQKRRHISTANHYKKIHQFFLGLFFVSKFFLFALAICCLFLFSWKLILCIVGIYYLVEFIVIGFSAKQLQEKKIIFLLPILEIGLLLFQFSIFITNTFSKPTHWK
ncbi:glycosyltransferase [Polaribacter sp.]|nr:glycosyltransferase [Polaribacter sp.]